MFYLNFEQNRPEKPIEAHLECRYDVHLPENVLRHPVSPDVTCIADGIDSVLTSYDATLIAAPTGFGKTYWVLHEILPRVIQGGGKMLLVSNRVAVSYQQKLEIMKLIDTSEICCLTPEGVLRKTDFGPVNIMTLQALDLFLSTPDGKEYAREVSVLVVDEVHYFTADVSFNPNAARLLKVIPQLFNKSVRIYMTATPEDVLRPLAQAEANAKRPMIERTGARFSPLALGQAPVINLYRYESSKYQSLPIRYFEEYDELYPVIENSGDGKWLIFVSNKSVGESIKEEISDAVFVSSDSKGSVAWNELLSEEQSHHHVLITTSVLDCGVNIHDDKLKHVVIPFEDRVTFMQALGRKRFENEPNFTLYIKSINRKRLNGLIYRNRELLYLVDDMRKHRNHNGYVDRFRHEGDPAKNSLVYLDYDNRYKLNDLYCHSLYRQQQYYEELMELIDQYGKSAFPRRVHQWLGQPDAYNEPNWLGHDASQQAREDLLMFLRNNESKLLTSEEERMLFSNKLYEFYKIITGKKKRKGRGKGGYLKMDALNNCMEEMGISGVVKSSGKGDGWILTVETTNTETEMGSEQVE